MSGICKKPCHKDWRIIMAGMRAMMQSVSLQEQYDENAKRIISQKPFLANILVRTVKMEKSDRKHLPEMKTY